MLSARRRALAPLVVLVAALGLLAAPADAAVLDAPATPAPAAPAPATSAPAPAPVTTRSSVSAAAVATPVTAAQRDALRNRVVAALAGSSAGVVASAVDVTGYGAVVRRSADTALPPASTQKSYVGLSALLAVGTVPRYRTEVVSSTAPVLGRLRGHLWLVAGGDPHLTRASLRDLAARVRASGVTSVSGEVRLDDTRYDARRTVPGWKASYVPTESGPLSALAVDGNRWRADAAYLADPALPAAALFRDHLRAAGVSIGTAVRRDRRPVGARTVAVHTGGTMAATVSRTLKVSDNFAAELVLKEIGLRVRHDGSSAGGIAAVRTVLGARGVPVGAGTDGSGLSSYDRQTPAGQLRLLHAADASTVKAVFRSSLAVGCVDGTLVRRFCGTAAAGRVWAKTGTLRGVRVLAGTTRTASGRDVHFAFQLTGVADGAKALAAIDRAVVVLAGSTV